MNTTLKTRTTRRAEDTRRKIYEAAMELFREKGFEETTMRDIAAKAGVALGGAYYYFSSKDAIVLEFYRQMQQSSDPLVLGALEGKKKLGDRIRCIVDQRLQLLEPNRKFCAALFRHAPDSTDPLSPFSEESRQMREGAVEQMRDAIEGSDKLVAARIHVVAQGVIAQKYRAKTSGKNRAARSDFADCVHPQKSAHTITNTARFQSRTESACRRDRLCRRTSPPRYGCACCARSAP